MKVMFEWNGRTTELKLGKINLFFGFNGCGKTKLLNILNDGFNNKLKKQFLVDFAPVDKSDNYKIAFLDNKIDIKDHLKLNSKSIINHIFDKVLDDEDFNNRVIENLNSELKELNTLINDTLNSINDIANLAKFNNQLEISSLKHLIEDNSTIKFENFDVVSSSAAKELLIISTLYSFDARNKNILIIDNFDCDFDLSNSLNIILKIAKLADDKNCTVFLSSNNSEIFPFIFNDFNIFSIGKTSIIDFSYLEDFIRKSFQQDLVQDCELDFFCENYLNASLPSIAIICNNKNISIQDNRLYFNSIMLLEFKKECAFFINYIFNLLQ